MGVYIIGTQYEKNWFNIGWSQPIPGGLVYPQQEIATPFLAYPTGGQLWAENSGTVPGGPPGCGHWQDVLMALNDGNATYAVNLAYLQDNLGRNWLVGVSNNGIDITATQVSYPVSISVVLLQDLATSQTWMLTVIPNGSGVDFQITPVGGSGGIQQQLCIAPNGGLFGIQITNGALQTAFALPSMAQQGTLIMCSQCSYIQMIVPTEFFYDSFKNPVQII